VTPDEFRRMDGAGGFDAAFFHLANNPFHEFVYELFLDRPGIAVFHETVLHHFLHHATREVRPDHERYRAMLRADYGGAGDRLANLRERGIQYRVVKNRLARIAAEQAGPSTTWERCTRVWGCKNARVSTMKRH